MQSQEKFNKINETMKTVLRSLNEIIDVNTVVGSPINSEDGSVLIPVSKVTVGFMTGGGEYGKLSIFKKNDDLPFSAGNGAIVSIKPCAFLIKETDKYKIINISSNSYEKLMDKASDFIMDLKNESN